MLLFRLIPGKVGGLHIILQQSCQNFVSHENQG